MWKYCQQVTECTRRLFRVTPPSEKSRVAVSREMSSETIVNRVKSQVQEYRQKGLPYSTPEEWDSSFYQVGGGPSRRKSSAILVRLDWEEFLKIIQNF